MTKYSCMKCDDGFDVDPKKKKKTEEMSEKEKTHTQIQRDSNRYT